MNERPTAESDVGFIETMFGFKVDRTRLLREQAECVVCGGPGFHTHVFPPEKGSV